jgi:hypothetical protein
MKTKLILMSLLGLFLSWTGAAQAFCVENHTPYRVDVVELYPNSSGMSKQISAAAVPGSFLVQTGKAPPPGYNPNAQPVPGRECCNWQNKECNAGGKPDSVVGMQVYVQVKAGTNIGLGPVGGESYLCGQMDDNGTMMVPFHAGGHIAVSNNSRFNSNKPVATSNPKAIVLVYDPTGRHFKTYPCPGAVRKATWTDLIPDWSDVIAG